MRDRIVHPAPGPRLTPPRRRALTWTAVILALIALGIAVLVAVWDWNWFRGPLARMASARTHREVTIAGNLDVHPFSWQPSATVDGVSIANPAWAGRGDLGSVRRIGVRIRLIPLLWGHLDIRQLTLDHPVADLLADAKGRKNWDFSNGRNKQPANLPPIRDFMIQDGRLTYVDARREIRFEGVLNAHERNAAQSQGFALTGHGTINRAPFQAILTGGPLLNIQRSRPYPFDARIDAGATHITARGQIRRPFDLGRFYVDLTGHGPDLAQLFPLTGIAFPNTPPYQFSGRLERNVRLWTISDLAGRVGASDLAGRLSVTTGGVRPLLKADLRSRSLEFRDLGALFGAWPRHGPAAVAAMRTPGPHHFFPDATLDFKRIRAMDADVTYKALSIRDAPVHLSAGSVHLRLDDALLVANPLTFDLPQGRVAGRVALNARGAVPRTDLDLRLTNARIEHLVPIRFQGAPPLTGAIVARAKLSGSGDSVHKALAHANGQVVAVAPGGEIRKSLAELLGLNVVKGLGLLMNKDAQTTPIKCAVADFQTRAGVMRADNIVFDTGPVLVTGSGTINLNSEQMDFRVRGHDKKFHLLRVLLPVKATGSLTAPKVGVEPGAAIAQGGAALALGSLLSPLAAIFPFVDPGLAKDANCAGLVAQAAQQGAPVGTAKTAPATR